MSKTIMQNGQQYEYATRNKPSIKEAEITERQVRVR